MEETGDHKRRREEVDEEEDLPDISSPEAKRLLLDILDDDAEAGDQDLASVMKSLEEEIALPSSSSSSASSASLPPPQLSPQAPAPVDHPDLGFLFEASDDELGLPPPPAPSSSDEAPEAEVAAHAVEAEGVGFGQIWGFDDDVGGYEGLEFGFRPEAEDGVVLDGGLFDYADVVLCGPSDFAELAWRSESLPAV